jgi:putative FmdB family regulatory protein
VPTYEYACTRCGEHVEVVQSMSDAPLTTCQACGGPLRKVFAPIGIVFKGSGFYRTDSRKQPDGAGDRAPAASTSDKPAADKPGGDKRGADKPGGSSGAASSSSSPSSSASEKSA